MSGVSLVNTPTRKMTKEFIFTEDRQSCHASTLLEGDTPGEFLVACFEGSCEGQPDVGIVISRRSANGGWTISTRWKINEYPHWNPVLFRLPDSRIACYFKTGPNPPVWQTWVRYSSDGGQSWTQPKEVVAGSNTIGCGPSKNKPILLHNGVILAPASQENHGWQAFIDRSEDGGATWHRFSPIPMPKVLVDTPRNESDRFLGVIQPSLWEDNQGDVHALMRSNNHRIYSTDSHDGGLTWSEIQPIGIPNNNSGLDLTRTKSGIIYLLCNPIPENWGLRNRLALFCSHDNGQNWCQETLIEEAPPSDNDQVASPEFSYPAIITTKDGRLAMTYTFNRRNIAFQIRDPQ